MTKLRKLCTTRWIAVLAVAAIFAVFVGSKASAQTAGAGTITGTVADAAQAVIPGATVTTTNVDTGVAHTYTTNTSGIYTAPFLQPGHYKVSAAATSFGTTQATGLTLLVGQTLTINLTMNVKSETTTVEVEGTGAILDTQKTEVSQSLDQHLIQNLPVAARNWSSFVLLTPAVTQDGGTGLVSFHGISGLYNQNYVDGANNNQMLFSEARGRTSGAPYVYSIDSIKEFQAETSNYSVEFGQAAGGQVNAITKSGTNALHGDLFWYLRYPDLNALDPYSKWQAVHNNGNKFLLTQPIHQQNQFGGSVGGALIKDRLFYFLTYDGFRKVGRVLYTDTNTISTSSQGVYSASTNGTSITPAQCPTASNSSYTGPYYITSTQCTNAINFLLNVSNMAANSLPPSRYAHQDLFFPRLDYHINAKNDAFVNFNWANFDSTNGYSSNPTYTNSSPSTNGSTTYHERFLVGGLTTVINESSVNQIHAQWGRDLETAGANAPGPSVSMGAVTYGMPNALPRIAEPDEHRIQFSDVFSHTMGRHTLKFGGDLNVVHEVMINLYQGGGLYSYGETTTTANFQDWVFDAFAGEAGNTDPYAGYHYNTFVQTVDKLNTAAGTQGKDDFWMKMIDGFAEDSWKVTPSLTLTAGVRYDVQLTPAPTMINTTSALATKYTSAIKNVMNRIQPRVGFSWSPYNGTVVRGGYGIFSGLNQGSTYYAMRVENGVVQVNYNATGCKSNCTAVPTGAQRYPYVAYQPTGPSLNGALYPTGGTMPTVVNGITSSTSASFHGLSPDFVPPYSHEMDLSVEQALPGKLSLMVGYVGTRGMRLPVFVDANLVGQKPSGLRTYNVMSGASNTGTVTRQLTVPVYQSADRALSTMTYSLNAGYSVANTWYNGLVATVRRPFSHGLEFVGNYTWSHASDDGQVAGANGTFFGGDVPLDPNNLKAENGLSDTDVRNRFTLSFSYKPTFAVANRTVRELVNGFQFSGSEIASAGQPIVASMSGTVSGLAEGGIYGGAISSGSGLSTTGRPPQIGRNSIIGPGFNDFDLRVTREIKLHGQASLQLSADAFNLLNHSIVTAVNTTHSSYSAALATGTSATTATKACAASATSNPAATGATFGGCIAPYSGTGVSAFGAPSTTNNNLYGPRQMQVAAKFSF
jgi:hypothetical protein